MEPLLIFCAVLLFALSALYRFIIWCPHYRPYQDSYCMYYLLIIIFMFWTSGSSVDVLFFCCFMSPHHGETIITAYIPKTIEDYSGYFSMEQSRYLSTNSISHLDWSLPVLLTAIVVIYQYTGKLFAVNVWCPSMKAMHVMVNECVLCEPKRSRVMLSHTQYSVSMITVYVNIICM